MKKTPIALAIVTAAAIASLSGCAMFTGKASQPTAEAASVGQGSTFHWNYDVANRGGVGLLRAFDDTKSTILQFVDIDRQNPAIFDSKGKPLTYNRVGQYAIVTGLHPWLAVTVLGEQSIVTNNAYKADDPAAQVSALRAADADKDAQLARVNAELDTAQKELAQVKAQLAKHDSDAVMIARELDVIETRVNNLAAKLVRVPFGFDSTAFAPSELMRSYLLAEAKKAQAVNIVGHTDAIGTTAANLKIANGRALAARAYLVQNGIDAAKIHVSAKASGEFVADNRTEAGRAKNRRVDIQLVGGTTATVAAN